MTRATSLVAAFLILATGYSTTLGADYYWDINGTNTGATDDGGGVADGAVTDASWNTASDGVSATPGTFPLNNRAIFSAGTNATGASTISGNLGTQSTTGTGTIGLNGMLIEEGKITIAGALAMAPTSVIELMPGTTLSTNTSGNISIVTTGGSGSTDRFSYKLDGTTAALETTNIGFAGSFVSTFSTITLNGGGTLLYSGPQINILQTNSIITGTGPLVKQGGSLSAGVLAIASACTYTGATIIDEGEIRIRTTANRLPTTTDVTVNANGVFNLNSVNQQVASIAGVGQVGLGSGTLTIDGSTSTTLDGPIGDTHNAGAGGTTALLGKLVKAGTSTLTLTNPANDIRGSVTLNAGGITVTNTGSLCEDVADLIVNGGTLTLNHAEEKVENLSGTGGSIVLNGTALQTNPSDATTSNTTYAGTISGTGSLKKTNYLWDSSAASPLRINLTATPTGDYRTLTLTGNNSYSGGTEIVGGGIRANSATALGTGTVNISESGKLDGNGQIANAITVQAGGHLGGGIGTANGTLLTASGTVNLQAGGSIDALLGTGATALVADYNNDGSVDAADYASWRNTNINGAQGYADWRSNFGSTGGGLGTSDRLKVTTNNLTLNAGGLVTILGTGTTAPTGTYSVLDYNTSFTGSLAGLYVNNATGMELTGGLVNNTTAHRIEVTVSNTAQVRSWAAAGSGNWSANPADAANWSAAGQPNGPGATATFSGGGARTVTIADSDKTLGTMNLNASGYTIAASGANQLIMNTYSGTPTINVTGSPTISAPLVTAKNTTINVNNGGDTLTISSGLVSNSGGLTKAGAGTVTVDSLIASTGTLTVSGGTLNLTNNNVMSGAITVAAGATLNAANTPGGTGHSATGSGAISNSGTLNVTGRVRGTVTTSNAGVTKVTGGSLAIQNLLNTTNIDTNGTLTGDGWTGGITDKTTGHLNPGGINTIGTLNANGIVNFNNGSNFDIDCGGGICDMLNITNNAAGTLVFPANGTGGNVNFVIHDVGGITDDTYTVINYNAGTTATATNALGFVTVSGPVGHTYSLNLDTANRILNLTITTPGSGSSLDNQAIPEPSAALLLVLGIIGLGSRRHGR